MKLQSQRPYPCRALAGAVMPGEGPQEQGHTVYCAGTGAERIPVVWLPTLVSRVPSLTRPSSVMDAQLGVPLVPSALETSHLCICTRKSHSG